MQLSSPCIHSKLLHLNQVCRNYASLEAITDTDLLEASLRPLLDDPEISGLLTVPSLESDTSNELTILNRTVEDLVDEYNHNRVTPTVFTHRWSHIVDTIQLVIDKVNAIAQPDRIRLSKDLCKIDLSQVVTLINPSMSRKTIPISPEATWINDPGQVLCPVMLSIHAPSVFQRDRLNTNDLQWEFVLKDIEIIANSLEDLSVLNESSGFTDQMFRNALFTTLCVDLPQHVERALTWALDQLDGG